MASRRKQGSVVKAGDELAVRFGQKLVTVKVNELKDTTKKEEAADMYTVLKEEKLGGE